MGSLANKAYRRCRPGLSLNANVAKGILRQGNFAREQHGALGIATVEVDFHANPLRDGGIQFDLGNDLSSCFPLNTSFSQIRLSCGTQYLMVLRARKGCLPEWHYLSSLS